MNEEARLSVLEEKVKTSSDRIEDLEKKTDRIETLTLSVQKLAISVENMAKEQIDYRNKQNEIASRLLEVEHKPEKEKAKQRDDVLSQLIHILIAALMGFVLAYFGLQ